MITVEAIARAIEGRVVARNQVLGRGPGHGVGDTSLSVWVAPHEADGFSVHSHAHDDFGLCRDYVRERLGLPPRQRGRRDDEISRAIRRPELGATDVRPDEGATERTTRALAIFRETESLWGSPVEAYLARERGLELFEALARTVRFHPACPFAGSFRTPAMVSLVRDVRTNVPKAIHRTALTLDGRKAVVGGNDRLSLGPVSGGAIKLTPDEDVTLALGIGEGIESALSLRRLPEFAGSPVWSLISANGIERLPVLAAIESLWIAVDHDEAGLRASQACADRWREADAEAFLVKPRAERSDLNDLFKGRLHG